MAPKKISEARTKYTAKTKRAVKSTRRSSTRVKLTDSVEALNQNLRELQIKIDEINQRLSAFESQIERTGEADRTWNDIKTLPLSLAEKREWVNRLCGVWAGDASLKAIFAEIEQQRAAIAPRQVSFNAAP